MRKILKFFHHFFLIIVDSILYFLGLFLSSVYNFFHRKRKSEQISIEEWINNKNKLDLFRSLNIKSSAKTKKRHLLLKFMLLMFIICTLYVTYAIWDLPSYRKLDNYNPYLTTRVYSSDGKLISDYFIKKRFFVSIDLVPEVVKNAFIAAEDKSFYHHSGIDFLGLARAMYNNVLFVLGKSSNVEGASTITQQVAKNLLLTRDRTIKRKIREFFLTLQLENHFSKNYILELYLNEIYLGRSSYGVAVASWNYFNKPISDLQLSEAALLAAMPKGPANYEPNRYYDRAKLRRDWVLNRMLLENQISQKQFLEAVNMPIEVIDKSINSKVVTEKSYISEEIRKQLIGDFGVDNLFSGLIVKSTIDTNLQRLAKESLKKGIIKFDNRRYGYQGPVDHIDLAQLSSDKIAEVNSDDNKEQKNVLSNDHNDQKQLTWVDLLKRNAMYNKYSSMNDLWPIAVVLKVTKYKVVFGLADGSENTLLLKYNKWAVDGKGKSAISRYAKLKDFNKILKPGDIIFVEELKYRKNSFWYLRQIPKINAAILAINPQNGEILAMQGGFNFDLSEFNRATQAKRQPGSAFKPFVYLTAISQNLNTNDKVLDVPLVMNNDNNSSIWRPSNNMNHYGGFVTLRNAIEQSRNLATIRIANYLGLEAISDTVLKLELYDKPLDNFSEVLGSRETTLMNLMHSYTVFATGGRLVDISLVRYVQNFNGEIIYNNDNRVCVGCYNLNWKSQLPPILGDQGQLVVDPVDSYIVLDLLRGVVLRGTGRKANLSPFNIAGKTGTTNDSKDAWFIAFTPDLMVGVYVGYDTPKSLGLYESSTSVAVPIVADFLRHALKDKLAIPFKVPSGLKMRWIDYKTGEPGIYHEDGVIMDLIKQDAIKEQRIISENGELQMVNPESSNLDDDGLF